MQFPQIRLEQTYAQIGLRQNKPVQEIQQVPAEVNYKQTPAQMTIERTPAKLEINQEQAWNERNLKGPAKLSVDHAEFSRQQALEAIAEIVAEGNQMARIETKSNAFADIDKNKLLAPPADFNVAFIPSHGSVQLNYQPTELKIDWQKGGVDFEVTPAKVIHDYTPGKTEVYLQQKPHLEIDFVGLNVNRMA